MRCPKCGFISFDHMETCLKCNKDISGKVEVEGTTYHAAVPSFLQVPEESTAEEESGPAHSDSEQVEEGYEFGDPDLDVLVDEGDEFSFDDEEASISFDDADLGDVEEDFQLEADDDSFDFELEEDDEALLNEQLTAPEMSVPDELSDISDLAPPEAEVADDGALAVDDDLSFSLDEEADLDGLDLNIGLGGGEDADEEELSLSLDDIDISADELAEEDIELAGLNMDLDLSSVGGKEPRSKEEKSAAGLDDISLSLD